jgi:hypothetical protein
MYEGRFSRVCVTLFLLNVLGFCWQSFFFMVQENFYGTENNLKPIFEALGELQLSMTSYSAVLVVTAATLSCVLIALYVSNMLHRPIALWIMHGWALLITLGYIWYEYDQALHPRYPDNNFLDAILGIQAFMTVFIAITWANKPIR